MEELNITSGEHFNQFFEEHCGKRGIPFNESMMTGKTCFPIFTGSFFALRAQELQVPLEQYAASMKAFMEITDGILKFQSIVLWFGADSFCQLNLLTILAYLEQIRYAGQVYSVTIDDHSRKILRDKVPVVLGSYVKLYGDVLIKRLPAPCADSVMQRALDLYLDYLSDDGKLARLVKDNPQTNQNQLVRTLLTHSREYGLSDLQALRLVDLYRK